MLTNDEKDYIYEISKYMNDGVIITELQKKFECDHKRAHYFVYK